MSKAQSHLSPSSVRNRACEKEEEREGAREVVLYKRE